jgi:hypothetical protein
MNRDKLIAEIERQAEAYLGFKVFYTTRKTKSELADKTEAYKKMLAIKRRGEALLAKYNAEQLELAVTAPAQLEEEARIEIQTGWSLVKQASDIWATT